MIYDSGAKLYDQAMAPFEHRFLGKWRKESLSHLPSDAEFLEIGAGTGLNFGYYPNHKSSVAIEISEKMIEIAKDKSPSANLVQADAEALPFDENRFDAAIATLVFCSISNPERAFAELHRVIKNKGRIVLLEHVRPNGLAGYFFDVLSIFTVALFEDHFNRETALMAGRAGLKIIEVRRKAFGIVNLIICEVEK